VGYFPGHSSVDDYRETGVNLLAMNHKRLYDRLIASQSAKRFELLTDNFVEENAAQTTWVPIGGNDRWNNAGVIDVSTDPGRALIERVTNAIDAVLEYEHFMHKGLPECRSPKEAASAWLKVPDAGLSALTQKERKALAQKVRVTLAKGDAKDARIVEIRDTGIGIAPPNLQSTILSLNGSNKMQKHYLSGAYGQGGSSTFAVSKYTLIASRNVASATVGFTIVKYEDLPPDQWKIGHYVYLAFNNEVLQFADEAFEHGTQVRHYGFNLHDYSSPLGPTSVYGLLNEMLFEPIIPISLDNQIHDSRRVIKGSCTALQEGIDPQAGAVVPDLSHNIPAFSVPLGEHGSIAIQYWVLVASLKHNKIPIAAFVNPRKPIVLTFNGQNHAELSVGLVRQQAELPYLAQRLIVHVDCNGLSPEAKRSLFSSTREDVRKGLVKDKIEDEIISALKADDDLRRLNTEAYESVMTKQDEQAKQQMREEVSKLLRLQGLDVAGFSGASASTEEGDASERITHPRKSRPKPKPIDLHEPPTFIRIVWPHEKPIGFYPGQSRYIRIETDAQSHYHNHTNSEFSRVNVFRLGNGLLEEIPTTPLKGGRMRVILRSTEQATTGEQGKICIELTRPGLPVLRDERNFEITKMPSAKSARKQVTLPPFRCIAIDPQHEMWSILGWPDDPTVVATQSEQTNGELQIYYSTVFPQYANQLALFERKDITQAKSFMERYQLWIAVHSLFIFEQQQSVTTQYSEAPEEKLLWEREERCRSATLAVLFAAREVKSGIAATANLAEKVS
jgi:hypothetical protein